MAFILKLLKILSTRDSLYLISYKISWQEKKDLTILNIHLLINAYCN